jgi:hypothetical protein
VLRRRHHKTVFPADLCLKRLYACGRVVPSNLIPELGPGTDYQVDSADRSSWLTQSRDRGNEFFSLARVQSIELEVSCEAVPRAKIPACAVRIRSGYRIQDRGSRSLAASRAWHIDLAIALRHDS